MRVEMLNLFTTNKECEESLGVAEPPPKPVWEVEQPPRALEDGSATPFLATGGSSQMAKMGVAGHPQWPKWGGRAIP